ncbi:MAG: hypothetical protein AAGA48_09345 [Myxococcota bacterium]
MNVPRGVLIAVLGAGCAELPDLVTPEVGSCPDTIDNTWPAFEGIDREDFFADGESGYEEGQIPPDFNMVDQDGNEVCLWQMVNHYVVLDTSALWCRPCREVAKHVPCVSEVYGDDVIYVTLITQGATQGLDSNLEDVQRWTEMFELDQGGQTPVLLDSGGVYAEGFPGDALPSFLLLGPDLRILYGGETKTADREIRNRLDDILGKDSSVCDAE